MVNLINYMNLCVPILLCCYSAGISSLRLEPDTLHQLRNETKYQSNRKGNIEEPKDDEIYASDQQMTAADYQQSRIPLPLAIKPRGFNLPKNRPAEQKENHSPQSAAQNYYNNFFSDLPPLKHDQPYYSHDDTEEDPLIIKLLSQLSKQFELRQQNFGGHDAGILGSGDFGILKGGTFYSDEQSSYSSEDGSDIYYGDASNTHTISSTEGFIKKYTYPEEQFAQFKDFADLGTPVDSDFSEFVVVYAAKNSTSNQPNSKPKNIFEQLQEIDREKAVEQKKFSKTSTNPSITKLKLVKTKLMEKKWAHKQPTKYIDDDPLIALS